MTEPEFQKNTIAIRVSAEMLAFADAMRPAWEIAMGIRPDPRTPEQIEADRAARQAERERERAEVEAAHASTLIRAEGIVRAVLELHAPVFSDHRPRPHCEGCDVEGYEWDWPDFPCSTYELVAGA